MGRPLIQATVLLLFNLALGHVSKDGVNDAEWIEFSRQSDDIPASLIQQNSAIRVAHTRKKAKNQTKKKSDKKSEKTRKNKKGLKKSKVKSVQQKIKNNELSKWEPKQACDELALCKKIKDYIRNSNQLRKVRRIIKSCDTMDKKANKSGTEFESTVASLEIAIGSNSGRRMYRSKVDVTTIKEKLKNCSVTAKAKCQKSSVAACQEGANLTKCEKELKSWLTMFGPAKGSCLQASSDCCACITALPDVSKDCLKYDQKSVLAVAGKKKCTNGDEQGSFGFCKKLQVQAAINGSKHAKENCEYKGVPLITDIRPFDCDIGACFYVKIDPSIIQSICLASIPSSNLEFNGKSFSYKGKVPPRSILFESADGTQAIFTCSNGTSLYGSISVEHVIGESGSTHIEPSNNNDHTMVSLPHSDLHEQGIPDPLANQTQTTSYRTANLLQKGARDTTTMARYSIKFYYTPQFASATPDISTFIDQALAVLNLGYTNSKVPLEAYSLCQEQATIDDRDSGPNMLEKFKNMKSSMNELRGGADIAALLVNEFSSLGLCTISYINSVLHAGLTISVTRKGCIFGCYGLSTAIAYNIGLEPTDGHLIQAGDSSYGRRTLMAFAEPGHETRVNYYSNPDVIYPGTNTATGVEGVSNSAALLIQNRFALENIGHGIQCDGDGCSDAEQATATISRGIFTYRSYVNHNRRIARTSDWISTIQNKAKVSKLTIYDDAAAHLKSVTKDGTECPRNHFMDGEVKDLVAKLTQCGNADESTIVQECNPSNIPNYAQVWPMQEECAEEYVLWINNFEICFGNIGAYYPSIRPPPKCSCFADLNENGAVSNSIPQSCAFPNYDGSYYHINDWIKVFNEETKAVLTKCQQEEKTCKNFISEAFKLATTCCLEPSSSSGTTRKYKRRMLFENLIRNKL